MDETTSYNEQSVKKPIKLTKKGVPDKRGQTSISNMTKARQTIKDALAQVRNNILDTDSEDEETVKKELTERVIIDPETEYETLFHQREQKVREELDRKHQEELKQKDLFYKEEIIKAKQGLIKNMRSAMVLKF